MVVARYIIENKADVILTVTAEATALLVGGMEPFGGSARCFYYFYQESTVCRGSYQPVVQSSSKQNQLKKIPRGRKSNPCQIVRTTLYGQA